MDSGFRVGSMPPTGGCGEGLARPAAPVEHEVLRAIQVDAVWESTCAVSVEGDVYCWGDSCHGAPVDGLFDLVCSWPKQIHGLSRVQSVAIGDLLADDCVLDRDGAVFCGPSLTAVQPVKLPKATAIANASLFACALLTDKTVSCWAGSGQPDERIGKPVQGLTDIRSISARAGRAMAIDGAGAVFVFDARLNERPQRVDIDPTRALALSEDHAYLDVRVVARRGDLGLSATPRSEGGYACALRTDGGIRCWGGNDGHGELGDGRTCQDGACATGYADVGDVRPPTSSPAVSLTTGIAHSCSLHEDGSAYCWGNNATGELGAQTSRWFSDRPVKVDGDHHFKMLTAANNHTCGLTQEGEILCWGDNQNGQLGRGLRSAADKTPLPVAF